MAELIRVTREAQAAHIELARPDVHNAFDDRLIIELIEALIAADTDDTVRVVLLKAEGQSFSAGADLQWMRRMAAAPEDDNRHDALRLAELMRTLAFMTKPAVAKVHGSAFGGGVGLVACCDIAIAADTAKFGLTETKLGLVPAVISPYVIDAIGCRNAMRYFQTAEIFDAKEALRIGLVHAVVAADQLDAAVALQLALLTKAGPQSLRNAKELVHRVAGMQVDRRRLVDEENAALIARLRVSPEGQEGIAAFLEKTQARVDEQRAHEQRAGRMTRTFDKVLIANRGEIACRVIRTCRRLGIATVAVYSDADANAQHVRLADEAVHIGASRPNESYLRGDVILAAAQKTGAQAIHPGYGFLSENADFADAVEQAGIAFIGPRAASMRKMGSKAGAKILMQSHGVPVVPGYTGEEQTNQTLVAEAARVGFPLMIKAAHGGGGKGMRIVRSAEEFEASLESCQRESRNAFGRDRVLLERYLESPRHIEFQIFGDTHGRVIHLNERECSAQRRYQKVIEETPSPFLDAATRERMGAAAIAAGKAIDYVNAGTVEFIVSNTGEFFFMEINTRLQVEHPVTEMTLGLDLVEWQLRVAAGEPLPDIDLEANGHAIEVRLYAEDPEKNFLPGSGKLERLALPEPSANVRIDSGVIEGDTVTIFYDPMIAKLVVHDRDRPQALARLRDALAAVDVVGPRSNVEFLEKLVRHPVFVEGRIHTAYLDQHLDEVLPTPETPSDETLVAAATLFMLADEKKATQPSANSDDRHSPWASADAWRIGHAGTRRVSIGWRDQRFEVAAHGHAGQYRVEFDGRTFDIAGAKTAGGFLNIRVGGQSRRFRFHDDGHAVLLHDGERRARFEHLRTFGFEIADAKGADRLIAPMPGRIVALKTEAGATVAEGDELIVMEAMKMELSLKAPRAGIVAAVSAAVGDFVEADAVLVRLGDAA